MSASAHPLHTRQGFAVWLTGLSGSGKTTICRMLAPELRARGFAVQVLDGDHMRKTLCCDLGFSKADRDENILRIGWLARLLVDRGYIVLVAAISPYQETRLAVRRRIGRYIEVYVDASLSTCIQRDPKRLYARALAGKLPGFTGIEAPYEPPMFPDVRCDTESETCSESVAKVFNAILQLQTSSASPACNGRLHREDRTLP